MARNVLVTGSSSGIGAATAIAFAKNGDNVGITYNRKPDDAMIVAEKCRSYGVRAEIFGGDISKREVVEQMMTDFLDDATKTVDAYGRFIKEMYEGGEHDMCKISVKLIEHIGGVIPTYLFLPLYTVREHIKEFEK